GPPAYADGDLRRATSSAVKPGGFNGAAGLRRRRPVPSNRPRRQPSGFNGAAGLRRRRRLAQIPAAASVPMLQWGRRPTPTETWRLTDGRGRLDIASMGPPAYADGD